MSLKTGDAERHAREDYLTQRLTTCDFNIATLLKNPLSNRKWVDDLDNLRVERSDMLRELDGLYLQSGFGDFLDEDYSDYFRDDLDIDKIISNGGGYDF
jgi:hypothetical protein